ncbi:hypothetical protein BO78DRAFT_276249, partial [Aspergillus sclerotiicarbonarius CBS 121057]
PSILAGLPKDSVFRDFSNLEELEEDIQAIKKALNANNGGNQWLVIRNLTETAIDALASEESPFPDVEYCFEWDGSVGLVKIFHCVLHDYVVENTAKVIDHQLRDMGVPTNDCKFHRNRATVYETTSYGKNADWIFTPASRRFDDEGSCWPTLVIEAGVGESRGKLIENAKWWFANSAGTVRIVLLILMGRKDVRFEKWQLTTDVPDNQGERPDDLQIVSLDPYRIAYPAQKVRVTEDGVFGAPMTLHFEALYDRPAR